MPKFKTPISVLFLGLLAFSACQSTGSTSSTTAGKGESAALVNGSKITIAEVDRVTTEQAQGQQAQLAQLSPLELAAARLKVLDSLITNEILFQRAKKDNLLPSEQDITSYIQQSKVESGMTEDAFTKRLKETNQTEAEFKEDIRKSLAVKKLQENISAQIKVSDREVEDFFKANPPVAAAGIALSDIIVDPAQNFQQNVPSDAKGEAEAKRKIDEVYAQLKRGGDFATVARSQSEDASANRAGDLGFIAMEQIQQSFGQFAAKIMTMKEGDITEPLREGNGRWHIFKMTGKRTETKRLSLEDPEVKKQLTDEIRNQRASLLYSALVTQARDEAKIENYLVADLVKNPNSLGVLRPVAAAPAAPAAQSSTSPAASVPASPAASIAAPATSVSPATTPKK